MTAGQLPRVLCKTAARTVEGATLALDLASGEGRSRLNARALFQGVGNDVLGHVQVLTQVSNTLCTATVSAAHVQRMRCSTNLVRQRIVKPLPAELVRDVVPRVKALHGLEHVEVGDLKLSMLA